MYYNLAKKEIFPESCKNHGLKQLSRGQKRNLVLGFPETFIILGKSTFPPHPQSMSFTWDGLANVKINRQPLKNLRKTAAPPLPHPAVDSSCRNRFWVSRKPLKPVGKSMVLNVELVWLRRTANSPTCNAR